MTDSMPEPEQRSWSTDELVDLLIDVLETEIFREPRDLSADSNLEETGLDSLKLTQVLLSVEERTGLWLDEDRLTQENLRTVKTLAQCIHDALED
jgi:acyl carrier protein